MIDNNLLSEEHAPQVYTFYNESAVLLYDDAQHSYVRLTDDGAFWCCLYSRALSTRLNCQVPYNSGVPKVTFLPENKTVEFELGKMPYDGHGKPESILDVAENFGVHLDHACGGSCACTTCHIIVKEGVDNLSEADDDELDRLEMAAGLTLRSRLGCQAVVKGDVIIEIPAWNRNYISEGGSSTL